MNTHAEMVEVLLARAADNLARARRELDRLSDPPRTAALNTLAKKCAEEICRISADMRPACTLPCGGDV